MDENLSSLVANLPSLLVMGFLDDKIEHFLICHITSYDRVIKSH